MKIFSLLLPAVVAGTVIAQTTTPAPGTNSEPRPAMAATNAATTAPTQIGAGSTERQPTEIFSDSANFDLKTRIAVYVGHVRVLDPQMKLTCGLMTARVPESGKIDSIVAEQDVVIDALDNEGRPVHATGDKAVYTYRVSSTMTNETIELTGNPQVKSPLFSGTGDTITWDRANNTVGATHPHLIIQQEAREHTNAPGTAGSPEKQ
jgi:lipopolysaccharide transport protein LptA